MEVENKHEFIACEKLLFMTISGARPKASSLQMAFYFWTGPMKWPSSGPHRLGLFANYRFDSDASSLVWTPS
jgi:hypothetical protein